MEMSVKSGIGSVEDESEGLDMAEVDLEDGTLGECPECGRVVKDLGKKFACIGWQENTCSFCFNRSDLDQLYPGGGEVLMEFLLNGQGFVEHHDRRIVRTYDMKIERRWSIATKVNTYSENLRAEDGGGGEKKRKKKREKVDMEKNYLAFSL